MPTFFIHLENALKRANEFIEVGNKDRALGVLADVLHNRKHRTWQKMHEEIMSKYLELCVELRQNNFAKEGLHQYKLICQQAYVSSLQEAIRKYISMAEQKAQEAKELSQANLEDIDDLDNAQTPEDILLNAVSTEDNQDRKERVILIPWVKFLWESYRLCLDLLRHNARAELLYHEIARKTFEFCEKFNRKTEFRKLCDILHLHLDQLKRQQNQNQSTTINLSDPETQTHHLETRLRQLDLAIQMELWQEAYKATDDIKKFNLMGSSKKGFGKPSLISSYYQKLALVFWKANSPLFHAAALFRHFHLNKDLRKNLTPEEAQKLASRLVVATLAIPIPPIRPEVDKLVDTDENVIDQHHRNLSILLGINAKPPTRASLIKDLKRMGVLQQTPQPVQDLYQLLEIEFNPLEICAQVQKRIEFLEKGLADESQAAEIVQYIPSLKKMAAFRLIQEVSQVYRTIEFDRLSEFCPFLDRLGLEKLIVESARRHGLQIHIDHRRNCFVFGNEFRNMAGEEYIEGPYLQSMPNEKMRRQLVSFYSSIQNAADSIESDLNAKKRLMMKRAIMKTYFKNADQDHKKILARQELIQQQRELISRMDAQRAEEERRRAEEQAEKLRLAGESRLLEENRQRERLRREKEENELRKQMNKDQLMRMKHVIPDLNLDELDDDELAKLKPQDVQRKRVEQFEKERKESLAKQRKIERKLDHLERAKRLEEISLLEAEYEEYKVSDRQVWTEFQKTRVEEIKKEREFAFRERDRIMRLMRDKNKFTEIVMETRKNEYEQRLKEFELVLQDERKKRLEIRKQKRIDERRVQYNKEKEAKRALWREMQRKKEEAQSSSNWRIPPGSESGWRRRGAADNVPPATNWRTSTSGASDWRDNNKNNNDNPMPNNGSWRKDPNPSQSAESRPSTWRRPPQKDDASRSWRRG